MKRRITTGELMPLGEAVSRLTGGLSPVTPVELAPEAAVGAILAVDARAPVDSPPRTMASRDGWAVAVAEVAGASPYAPIPLASPPAWVDSGDALPAGRDTVLPPDAIQTSPPEALADAPPGEGVIPAGGDAAAGIVLAAAGMRLTAIGAAALALAGCRAVSVRRPRIRILSVGHRPFHPAPPPPEVEADRRPGQPEDSALSRLLAARAEAWCGCIVATDQTNDLPGALAAGQEDATIVIGGTGFGRNDASVGALAAAGDLTTHGIALRPGSTAGFGRVAGRPVLLIPGRPEAALAALLALGAPLLRHLAGAPQAETVLLRLRRKITSTIGLTELVFVQRVPGGIVPLGSADLPLHRLALAEGAVLVPPEREGYQEGIEVETIPL